jgi:hypothetical protein
MTNPRGRRKHHESTTPWSFNMPSHLAMRVDLLLLDPMTGKVKYGSRIQLIEQLLREWLAKQVSQGLTETTFHPDATRYANTKEDKPL